MLQNPPLDPTEKRGHKSIVWPQDLLLTAHGEVVGFLMPRIRKAHTLNNIYNPKRRRKVAAGFNWYYLHTAALNLAWILNALHEKSYVVGDLKPENFLVTNQSLVSAIDTDSFQFPHGNDVFLCPVGSEGFTPPELIGKDLSKCQRSELHDRFGLAVLIHFLLFGSHPFSGVWRGKSAPPPVDQLIQEGHWPHTPKSPLSEGPLSIPLTTVSKPLQEAFRLAFDTGHKDPSQRPSAKMWGKLLEQSLTQLKLCDKNAGHFYAHHTETCPWCLREEKLGIDIFPPPPGARNDPFLIKKRFERASLDQDDRQILRLWNDHRRTASLSNDSPQSLSSKLAHDRVAQAKAHHDIFEEFEKCVRYEPYNDKKVLQIWASNPAFSTSKLADEKGKRGKTPRQIAKQARHHLDLLEKMTTALAGTPIDFQAIIALWDKDILEKHPAFQEILPQLHQTRELSQQYGTLVKGNLKDIPASWNEDAFGIQAQRDGFAPKIQKVFQNQLKLESPFFLAPNSLLWEGAYLKIRWHWGDSPPDGCLVAAHHECFPKKTSQFEQGTASDVEWVQLKRSQYNALKGAFVPFGYVKKRAFVSIWPTKRVCGKYVPYGKPLTLHNATAVPLVKYTITRPKLSRNRLFPLKRKNKSGDPLRESIQVTLRASQDLKLPAMELVASFGHPPVAKDSESLQIDALENLSLEKERSLTIQIPYPDWLTDEYHIGFLFKKPKDYEKIHLKYV